MHSPLVLLLLGAALGVAVGCRTTEPQTPVPGTEPSPAATTRSLPTPRSGKGGALETSRPDLAGSETNTAPAQPVVLPAGGRVHMVNLGLRFIVIDYTLGGMPPMGSVLGVFRNGEKVAQVRLSGPEPRNGFVTADIMEGFIQVDDEVRLL